MIAVLRRLFRSPWRAAIVMLIVGCAAPGTASAQSCSFTMTNLAFGNVSTITGAPVDANAIVTANCSGFSTSSVRMCLSFGAVNFNPRTLPGPSGKSLNYGIYTDAAHTIIWGTYASSTYPANIIDLPLISGSGSTTVTAYGRILAGQTGAITGTYSQQFTTNDVVFWWAGFNGTPPACGTITPSQRVPFLVSATVVADCNITANPLAFPAVTALANAVSATTKVSVTCVSNAPYTVALDGGTTPGASTTNRLMQLNGGTSTVSYGLYKDAAWTQVWGDGTGGTTTNAGTGTGGAQTFTVYGRVPSQPVPPPGNYSDTITATVSF